jgi:hypothetical protein
VETRETLEAALLSSWDRDTLVVYADHLQAEGDPRGELIALDLQIEATGNTVELSKRRTSLVFAWLGALVPVDDVHASWVGDSLRFGFVEDLHFSGARANAVARLEQAFESAAGPYVRALSMIGTADELAAALAVLARHEHRWLTKLAVTGFHQAPVAPQIVADALRALPNLATLELHRPCAFANLSHAGIKRLVLEGRDAYVALGEGAAFDAVETLVLDLGAQHDEDYWDEVYDDDPPEAGAVVPALPRVAFPALRRLELTGTFDDALAFLRSFDARANVRALRIPHLRSATERNDLIGAIRDMRALATIEVAHGSYYDALDIPNITLVRAAVWPWPMQEAAQGAGLRLFMPGAKYGDTVAILDAVLVMERSFEQLPLAARTAWSALWRAISPLPSTGSIELSARLLADAVESIPSLMQNGWRELREELSSRRPLAADAMVKIERCVI